MIRIAICDDDAKIGAELERILQDTFTRLEVESNIQVFISGGELIQSLESGAHYDLLFLDIEFAQEDINGVEIGRLIRETHHNNTTAIVYISWEKSYSMQLFDIRPLHFLIKPLEPEKVAQVVNTYLQISRHTSKEFSYKKGHNTFKLPLKDIIYFESLERKIVIHLADGRKEEFYGSLKRIYSEQLKKLDVLFIHAAYIVNYDYISVVKYDQVLLADSATPLPISPNRRREVRETYLSIMKRRRP